MPGPETEMTLKGHDAWDQSIPVKVDANIHGLNGPLEATISSPTGKVVAVETIINGNSLNPIAALVSSPPGEAIAANVDATINGGTPVTAIIDGGTTPVSAAVMATVTSPIKLDVGLGDIGLRNTTINFKLFGLFTILTIEVGP